MSTQINPTITMLDPSVLLVGENIRFSLKKHKLDSLRKSIEEAGEIQVPIEVEPLTPSVDGKTHRVTTGHYRTEVAVRMNADGAGLKIPAIVRPIADPTDRLKRQLRENVERESLSTMDEAVAIQKLLDAGVSKPEIRQIFAKPGGRKGLTMAPVSNAYVNMIHSFLKFPKQIQERIHDGRLTVGAAYELSKSPSDKWQGILDRAEADRQKCIDNDEREETRFLAGTKRAQANDEYQKEVNVSFDTAKAALDTAKEAVKVKTAAAKEAFGATQVKPEAKTGAEAKSLLQKATEHAKATQADSRQALKAVEIAQHNFDKVATKKAAMDLAIQKNATKSKVVPDKPAKGKAVGVADVRAAASESGVKAPSGNEMRSELKLLCVEGSVPPKVGAIGKVLYEYATGVITPNQLIRALAGVTGEPWGKKK